MNSVALHGVLFAHGKASAALLAIPALLGCAMLVGAPHVHAADVLDRGSTDAAGGRRYYLHVPPGDPAGKTADGHLHGCC
ncbi:hypothetical protein ACLMAL_01035 [Nocardia sp. CWNU-33]|uniref:hypothetical protein n=1 Tax=Nocardia sp. CWNU-33 TaxID=3392117 RepID=UPI00398E4088